MSDGSMTAQILREERDDLEPISDHGARGALIDVSSLEVIDRRPGGGLPHP
jgi:hypothetical protein